MYRLTVNMFRMDPAMITAVLNAAADVQARSLVGQRRLLLYDTGVVYRYHAREELIDRDILLSRGWGDCISLSVARAAELSAWGGDALLPGDPGFGWRGAVEARVLGQHEQRSAGAQYMHMVVEYRVDGEEFRDDPSARLGMYDGLVDASVLRRWSGGRVRARANPRGA